MDWGTRNNSSKCSPVLSFDVRRLNIMSRCGLSRRKRKDVKPEGWFPGDLLAEPQVEAGATFLEAELPGGWSQVCRVLGNVWDGALVSGHSSSGIRILTPSSMVPVEGESLQWSSMGASVCHTPEKPGRSRKVSGGDEENPPKEKITATGLRLYSRQGIGLEELFVTAEESEEEPVLPAACSLAFPSTGHHPSRQGRVLCDSQQLTPQAPGSSPNQGLLDQSCNIKTLSVEFTFPSECQQKDHHRNATASGTPLLATDTVRESSQAHVCSPGEKGRAAQKAWEPLSDSEKENSSFLLVLIELPFSTEELNWSRANASAGERDLYGNIESVAPSP
ncbi:hypothetical protein E5288_WYG022888 [Bos mutus]|uniref:Uncharacterized protein n=1 Tax=Bos mutus TaxID=72004 RepID=A0A6B0S3N5_9CETA|nr:hypothetical protein [Bos mutus]